MGSRSGPLVLAAAILVLLAVGVATLLAAARDEETPTTAATPTVPTPPAATPPAAGPATPLPLTIPPTEPSPEGAVVGSVRVADATDDVRDAEGNPPPDGHAAADLVAVQLDGDGQQLAVTFVLAGDLAPTELSLLWSVRIWVEDVLSYEVNAQQADGQVAAAVFDWDSETQQPLPEPAEVVGNRLVLRVPLALLPRLPTAFTWAAFSELDGAYNDTVPDAAEALLPGPAERARFP